MSAVEPVAEPTPLRGARDLVESLAEVLPEIIDELINGLRNDWPDYAEFLDQDREYALDAGMLAMERLVPVVDETDDEGGEGGDRVLAAFEDIGRIAWQEGRPLTSLLAAYRLGGQTAWRHVSRVGVEQGLSPQAIVTMAASVFRVVDELSSATETGYLAEQRGSDEERQRRRKDLADLLLTPQANPRRLRTAATAAAWPLPATACLVVLPDGEARERLSVRLGSSALPIESHGLRGVIVPEPGLQARRGQFGDLLQGCCAVVGAEVALPKLPMSLERVLLAAELTRRGILRGDPVFVEDNAALLLLHRDPDLLAHVVRVSLEPLDGLPASTRERMVETLRVWLTTMGETRRMAEALHVHPHTVHYRIGQLRRHLGDALDDPLQRLQLTIALASTPKDSDGHGPE